LVEQNGGQIVVLDQIAYCPPSELIQDLLSIINFFNARIHGLRKYSKQIKEDPDLSDYRTEKS
jgi:predicted site-specific integrase-resolvase